MLRSSLLRRFVAVLAALALLPVAFLSVQLIRISRRGIEGAVLELHTKLAEKLADKLDAYFRTANDHVTFALASLQKPMGWPEKQQLLRSLIETQTDIRSISMVNLKGEELLKVYNPDLEGANELASRADEPAFQQLVSAGHRAVAIAAGEDGLPAAILYYPMSRSVAARVEISLKRLGQSIASERVGGTGFAVFADVAGRPLLYPAALLDPVGRADFSHWPLVQAALQSNSVGSSEFEGGGRLWVGAYAPVSSVGGAVVILQSRAEAYRAAHEMRQTAAVVIVLVMLACVTAAGLLAGRLTRPLRALAAAAEAVSHGQFDTSVALATGDELQTLAETFNRMTAQLRHYSELQIDRLIAEQRKTEAILFSIIDGILMTDRFGQIQLANRQTLAAFDLPADAAVSGKPAVDVLPAGPLRDAVLAAAQNPDWDLFKDIDLSTELHHRYLRVGSRPVMTPKGERLGVLIVIRDVTLERELDKIKEEFLHYVTHDLRNPLGSAMGFVDVLLKGTAGVLNPDQHAIVSSVKRSTSRLMGMVNNILDIAKMESGRIHPQLKETSLAGIAGRAIAILESMAKNKRIDVQLAAAEEFTLQADADLLERVFTNLLGNAIKYTPEDGAIVISVVEEGAHIKCCVADTGEGIPKDYLERIFLKFEQVQGQRRGGTGLGLTIAKFFVESHLGRVWVESELGRGSQFYFTIPKGLAIGPDGRVVAQDAPAASAAA